MPSRLLPVALRRVRRARRAEGTASWRAWCARTGAGRWRWVSSRRPLSSGASLRCAGAWLLLWGAAHGVAFMVAAWRGRGGSSPATGHARPGRAAQRRGARDLESAGKASGRASDMKRRRCSRTSAGPSRRRRKDVAEVLAEALDVASQEPRGDQRGDAETSATIRSRRTCTTLHSYPRAHAPATAARLVRGPRRGRDRPRSVLRLGHRAGRGDDRRAPHDRHRSDPSPFASPASRPRRARLPSAIAGRHGPRRPTFATSGACAVRRHEALPAEDTETFAARAARARLASRRHPRRGRCRVKEGAHALPEPAPREGQQKASDTASHEAPAASPRATPRACS